MHKTLASIIALVVFTGCGSAPAPGVDGLAAYENAYSFLILGDFGRNGYHHQRDVAVMMDRAGAALDIEFVVTTGDNFYDNGVASVHDPIIQSSFERVYDGPELLVDWWVALGNHEYRGDIQALIDYSISVAAGICRLDTTRSPSTWRSMAYWICSSWTRPL